MNKLISAFETEFEKNPNYIFSAPGRMELSGNHTDHQHGKVLAAAVDLDTRAAVALNGENRIRVKSEGYPACCIELDDLAVKPEETGTTAALIRGVAARIKELTEKRVGFDAYVTSTVLPGSGLSSSAAFEVLMGTIINSLCGCVRTPLGKCMLTAGRCACVPAELCTHSARDCAWRPGPLCMTAMQLFLKLLELTRLLPHAFS